MFNKMRLKVLCLDLNPNKNQRPARMSPPILVTEDTPPDMLTGHMDLNLVLPNKNRVRMSVDRKTPMMDLLVQVTTAYKVSPAGHVLQAYGEGGLLPYKPSTPIGALDTWTVHIVPKHQAQHYPASKIYLKQVHPPFEQTFRFQVNLPRNQLYVSRVNGRTTMKEVLAQACSEKGLDPNKYALRHPKHLDVGNLCEELSIAEYGHNQVTMVSMRALPSAVSSDDILAMTSSYNGKSSGGSSRSLSPDSSVSPKNSQPSRPLRKRRPAPKPPSAPPSLQRKESASSGPVQHAVAPIIENKQQAPVISHSRTSSDSSGYHEASVLSESPDSNNSLPDSLPRRSKLPAPVQHHSSKNPLPTSKLSRSLSNLHHASIMENQSEGIGGGMSRASTSGIKSAQSVSCLAPSRKKKPAPLPPVSIKEEEKEDSQQPSPASSSRSSATLPASARLAPVVPSEATTTTTTVHPVSPVAAVQPKLTPTPQSVPVDSNKHESEHGQKTHIPLPLPRRRLPAVSVFDKLEIIMQFQSEKTANLNSQAKPNDDDISHTKSLPVTIAATISTDTLDIDDKVEIEKEIERMFEEATREHVSLESGVDVGDIASSSSPSSSPEEEPLQKEDVVLEEEDEVECVEKKKVIDVTTKSELIKDRGVTAEDPFNWEYKLPAPPTFRDEAASPPPMTTYSTVTVGAIKEILYDPPEPITPEPKPALPPLQSSQTTSTVNHQLDNFRITTYSSKKTVRLYEEKPSTPETRVSRRNSFKTMDENEDRTRNGHETELSQNNKYSPVKRSKSLASQLPRFNRSLSSSTTDLQCENKKDGFGRINGVYRKGYGLGGVGSVHDLIEGKARLRKTNSELSINIESDFGRLDEEDEDERRNGESGLQSLQVLRTILPHLSQSQGALNCIDEYPAANKEKTLQKVNGTHAQSNAPNVSLATWGERPKRQISIKSDRDYVFGVKQKFENTDKREFEANNNENVINNNNNNRSIAYNRSNSCFQMNSNTSSTSRNDINNKTTVQKSQSFKSGPKTVAYKTLETGNTKPLKQILEKETSTEEKTVQQSRLPVVRSVELKKPYRMELEAAKRRPTSCYLFGYEPHIPPVQTVTPPPPPLPAATTTAAPLTTSPKSEPPPVLVKKYTSVVDVRSAPTTVDIVPVKPRQSLLSSLKFSSSSTTSVSKKRVVRPVSNPLSTVDPREELLASIRQFGGKASLRKVSVR